MHKLLLTAAAFAATMLGADVTGKWAGPMEMTRGDETKTDSAYLVLKQTGGSVTGTVGPNENKQLPITKGSIEGDAIHIEASAEGGAVKVVVKLKVEGEKLVGDLTAEGGERPFTGKMTLSKLP